MKILHVIDHSLPLQSGYSFRCHNIFMAQKGMGFDPVVITSPKHEENWKKKGLEKEIINGFPHYRTGPASAKALPFQREVNLMQKTYQRIMTVSALEQPDLIHAHSPILNGIPAIRAARKLKIPVVYEIRAFWEDAAVDHRTYKENSWKYRLTQWMETRVCKKVDHIGILCNGLKKDLIGRGIPPSKITTVFNGINPEAFKPSPPDRIFQKKWGLSGKKVIGFIGSFYRYEGLDLLVSAFAQIASSHPELILLLVGGGEIKAELEYRVEKEGLSGRVVMPGRLPHEQIPGIYALMDILVYPRYSMRLTELVTPLKPLEAMAMGKALVASDVGGHKELIRHGKTGLLFQAGSRESLVLQLQRIMEHPALQASLQKQGSTWVKTHHTWKQTTASYRQIYAL